jgi:hypothetical protein
MGVSRLKTSLSGSLFRSLNPYSEFDKNKNSNYISIAEAVTLAETLSDEKQSILISSSACRHKFGFLGQRPKGTDIPDECLTCEKMIDCMVPERKDNDVTEQVTEQEVLETAKPEEVVEEAETKAPPEETVKEIEETSELNDSITLMSDEEFVVENAGVLYSQWSTTVLMNKETLQTFGKKVKEVEVETEVGRKMRLKIHSVEEVESKSVLVPDKLQLILGVKKGSIVKVKPVTN